MNYEKNYVEFHQNDIFHKKNDNSKLNLRINCILRNKNA